MKTFTNLHSDRVDARMLRLCKVALRIATALISEQAHHSTLDGCVVLEVRPSIARNQLVVVVGTRSFAAPTELGAVVTALSALRGAIRTELAQTAQRKRVPAIEFEWVPLTVDLTNPT